MVTVSLMKGIELNMKTVVLDSMGCSRVELPEGL